MSRQTQTPDLESIIATDPKTPPTFEIVGFQKSDYMPIAVDGRQIDLANVTPEVTAWLYERKEKLAGLEWKE